MYQLGGRRPIPLATRCWSGGDFAGRRPGALGDLAVRAQGLQWATIYRDGETGGIAGQKLNGLLALPALVLVWR